MAGKYRKFTPEFREEAARMVVETSRPIADVARELGINETSLGNWVRAYREKHAGDEPPLQLSERARLRELERENRELRDEERLPFKSRGVLRGGASVSDVYEFIDAEYATGRGRSGDHAACAGGWEFRSPGFTNGGRGRTAQRRKEGKNSSS